VLIKFSEEDKPALLDDMSSHQNLSSLSVSTSNPKVDANTKQISEQSFIPQGPFIDLNSYVFADTLRIQSRLVLI
jgi:hypothetical protein